MIWTELVYILTAYLGLLKNLLLRSVFFRHSKGSTGLTFFKKYFREYFGFYWS